MNGDSIDEEKATLKAIVKKFSCLFCDRVYNSFEGVRAHIWKHLGVRPFLCSVCGKAFSQKHELVTHLNVHNEPHTQRPRPLCIDRLRCKKCNIRFESMKAKAEHITLAHSDDPKVVVCEICGEGFFSIGTLRAHVIRTHSEPRFACPHPSCGRKFTTKSEMKQHTFTHRAGDKHFQCTECFKRFTTAAYLELHTKALHENESPFACDICGKKFVMKQHLQHHAITHTSEMNYKCELCDFKFRTADGLHMHMMDHTQEIPFQCPFCHKKLKKKDQYERHVLKHTTDAEKEYGDRGEEISAVDVKAALNKFPPNSPAYLFYQRIIMVAMYNEGETSSDPPPVSCRFCPSAFPTRTNLKEHMVESHGLRRKLKDAKTRHRDLYKCQCEKKFLTESSLQKHVRHCSMANEDGTNMTCHICNKKLCSSHYLAIHIKNVHTLTPSEKGAALKKNEENLKCPICQKVLSSRAYLKTHVANHAISPEEREAKIQVYSCSHCPKTFRDKQYFAKHEKMHVSGSKYICQVCNKCFITKNVLLQHVLSHASQPKKRPFQCAQCDKTYAQKQYLAKHVRIHQGEPLPTCSDCRKVFLLPAHLASHKLRIHSDRKEEKKFPCEKCDKSFWTSAELTNHRKSHSASFACDFCQRSFKMKRYLSRHMALHLDVYDLPQVQRIISEHRTSPTEQATSSLHVKQEPLVMAVEWPEFDDGNEEAMNQVCLNGGDLKTEELPTPVKKSEASRCETCELIFTDANTYDKHVLRHELRRVSCSVCHLQLSSRDRLDLHMLRHSKEEPYSCEFCQRQILRDKGQLRRHIMRHLARTFTCDLCGKSLLSMKAFKQHVFRHLRDNTRFVCETCLTSFSTKRSLRSHMAVHLVDKCPYKCEECGRGYMELVRLKEHQLTHTKIKPFQCAKCLKCFTTKNYYANHMLAHEGLTPHVCLECGKGFVKVQHLRAHEATHRGGETKHSCHVCNKVFSSVFYLRSHLDMHNGRNPFPCPICRRSFSTNNNMKRHLLLHEGEDGYEEALEKMRHDARKPKNEMTHLCPHCGREFTNVTIFKRHLNTHTGLFPHKCQHCGKGFNTRTELLRHDSIHSNVRHSCPTCGKLFRNPKYLKIHMDGHNNMELGGKAFQCDVCKKSFLQRRTFKLHLAAHFGNYTFECHVCGKGFMRRDRLENHFTQRHSTPHFHHCSMCEKKFRDPYYLKKHELLHTDRPPNKCHICDKAFSHASHLSRHLLTHKHTLRKAFSCQICGKQFKWEKALEEHIRLGRHKKSSLGLAEDFAVVSKHFFVV